MQNLAKYNKNSTGNYQVEFDLKLEDTDLVVMFKVKTDSAFKVDEKFSKDSFDNWGLWETDVVELFIQPRISEDSSANPYFEFQVSPLGQPFALSITKPREEYELIKSSAVKIFTQVDGHVWTSRFVIPSEFLNSENVYLGLFACLGDGKREFFGTNIDPEGRLDFHKPNRFIALEDLL